MFNNVTANPFPPIGAFVGCYMPWGATTLAVAAGTYEGEIELTYSTGAIWTLFDRLKFKVRADF